MQILWEGVCTRKYLKVGKVERKGDWRNWIVYDEASCTPENNGEKKTEFNSDVSLCCLDYIAR